MARVTAILLTSVPERDPSASLEVLRTERTSLAEAGHTLDIAIVDQGFDEDARAALRSLEGDGVTVHLPDGDDRQQTVVAGTFALRSSDAELLLFLPAPTEMEPGTVARLLELTNAHGDVDALLPAQRVTGLARFGKPPTAFPDLGPREAIGQALYWIDASGPLPCTDAFFDKASMLVRRGAFEEAASSAGSTHSTLLDAISRAGGRGVYFPDVAVGSPADLPPEGTAAYGVQVRVGVGRGSDDGARTVRPSGGGVLRAWIGRIFGRDRANVEDQRRAFEGAEEVRAGKGSQALPLPASGGDGSAAPRFVQISASPRFEESIGAVVASPTLELEPLARALPAGRYYLRIIDPGSLEILERSVLITEAIAPEPAPEPAPASEPADLITSEQIEISPYRPGDEHSILRLWKKVFKQERDMALWRWLFTENPAGIHIMLARKKADNEVVAQFAGCQLRTQIRDEVHTFAQMVDSMSDPDVRQSLSRSGGIFTQTVLKYVETWGRPGEEPFGYGLPNRLAYRIGKRTQGYTDVCQLEWRVLPVAELPEREPAPEGVRVEVVEGRLHEDIDALWERFRKQYPVMTVRDTTYLEWRYLNHPEKHYKLVFVERDGKLVGFASTAPNFIGQSIFGVGDWMLDEGEEEAGRAMVAACEQLARESGMERILGSFVPIGSPADKLWESLGYPLEKSQWKWVGRIYDPERLNWDLMRTGFYLTIGDSDLI